MKRRPRRYVPPQAPGAPEMVVEAAAGGALNGEHVVEIARWYLPEAMLRHEGGAEPENVRILRARGDSMEPAVHDGDRLLVDTGRKTPATGEMAVLWDGEGLVVKRVEIAPRTDKARRTVRRFSRDIDITYDVHAFAPDLAGGVGDCAGIPANGPSLDNGEPFEALIERCAAIEARANRPRTDG